MPQRKEAIVSGHVYKIIDVVGTSTVGVDDAIRTGIARAGQSVRNMRWFEVAETRGHIEGGAVSHVQVHLRIGFTIDDDATD